MPFLINGQVIKSTDDYLSKGTRARWNLSIRTDLKNDLTALSKHTKLPVSVMGDVWLEMLQKDPKLLEEFINNCRKY